MNIYKNRLIIFILIISGWTTLILALAFYEFYKIDEETEILAMKEAKASINRDLAYRTWASSHGGVYVFTDSITQPNPLLEHIQEREIITSSGKTLTLINPAYMMRQIYNSHLISSDVKGKITSSKVLRQENKPDEWEQKALKALKNGAAQFTEISKIGNNRYLRYMIPLITKKSCLKCHSYQGYKIGEIRGGLDVSVPLNNYSNQASHQKKRYLLIYLTIWSVGILGIYLSYIYINKYISQIEKTKLQLTKKNILLDTVNRRFKGLEEILHYKAESTNDLLEYTLKTLMDYTKSNYGAVYHYHEEKNIFLLNNYNSDFLLEIKNSSEINIQNCLTEAVNNKDSVIINTPSEYCFIKVNEKLLNSLTIPVFHKNKIVALFWVGNANRKYEEIHAKQGSLLLKTSWILVEQFSGK